MDMPVTTVLLLVLGAIGILDVGWYHLWSLRLYRSRSSRHEEIAHLTRGALYAALLALVLPQTPRGAWVFVGLVIFGADWINTFADTWLEKESRKAPLPHGEYMVHVAGSVLAGATTLAFALEAWPWRGEATALVVRPEAWMRLFGWGSAAMVASVVLLETGLHLRARLGGYPDTAREGATP